MKKLYIDIDGVLLTRKKLEVPENAKAFVKNLVKNFNYYLLTTHCRNALTAIK